MRLFYYPGRNGVTNFGDELNHFMWHQLLPGAFEHDDDVQFVGIGTLLNDRLPVASRTVIFGSGVGYYGPPRLHPSWQVYCVRGPRSAEALGLAPDLAVTDPAALISRLWPERSGAGVRSAYAYMPHWLSEPDAWKTICEAIGWQFIDPRWPIERVLAEIQRTETLVTEAMHGAIVADALRIPWIAISSRPEINAFKWNDWCESLEMQYEPKVLPTIWPQPEDASLVRQAKRWARLKANAMHLRQAVVGVRPMLSKNSVFEARVRSLEDRLGQLKQQELWRRGPPPTVDPGPASHASATVGVE